MFEESFFGDIICNFVNQSSYFCNLILMTFSLRFFSLQVEWERERLLVLEGKIKMTAEHMKDPVLKWHHDFKKVEVKVKKSQERKLSTKAKRKVSAHTSKIKLKWSSAVDKLKVKNFMDLGE